MKIISWLIALICATGCANSPHHEPMRASDIEQCSDALPILSATAIPIALQSQFTAETSAVKSSGLVARRIVVSVGLQSGNRTDRIVESSLAIQLFGGNLSTWTRLQTEHALIETTSTRKESTERREIATVQMDSSEIVIARSALDDTNLAGTMLLDLAINPAAFL